MILYEAIKLILRDLSTPSSFKRDWYGWVTNQMAHITVGVMLTAFISAACFLTFGEFIFKVYLWGSIAGLVAINEFALQKSKKWWDSLEDFVFIVLYGAGTSIIMFDEVEPGSPAMVASITSIAPICIIVATHLIAGALSRAVEEVRHGAK